MAQQKIVSLGEAGVLHLIEKAFGRNGAGFRGDDCAIIPQNAKRSLLVTTDLLTEHIHFLHPRMPAEDLGYKTLAVNLSDIAAMGGSPKSFFLSWALPRSLTTKWIKQFLKGMKTLATTHQVQLMGGDTTASKHDLFLNLLVLGEAHPAHIKTRKHAQPGDLIGVSGPLGDSKAGLECLLADSPAKGACAKRLIERHFRPRPHLAEGRLLGRSRAVTAMMDVSDGLHSDLKKLLKASGVGAEVSLEDLPLSQDLRAYAREKQRRPESYAVSGGEDYVLLFTVNPQQTAALQRRFVQQTGNPFSIIGKITARPQQLRYYSQGRPIALRPSSFEHF